jgi:hypothetical protein
MSKNKTQTLTRRRLLTAAAVGVSALAAPAVLRASGDDPASAAGTRRNISSFAVHDWRDHFDALGLGAILSDTNRRTLQHWTADGEMRIYPTSVPATDELTRRGYTEVVEKRENPGWAPTPTMRERNPEWPAYVPGGDPTNPLGTRALYLSWQYYRIHGTQDAQDRAPILKWVHRSVQRTD